MKKMMASFLALLCISFAFVGCSKTAEESTYRPIEVEAEESTFLPTEVENVSLSITDVSPSGATVTIRDTNENPYVYGQWYKVEAERDGKWYDIKLLSEYYGFTEEGWIVGESDELNFNVDWSRLYGRLSAGRYRLLKEVKHQYIAVEFNITE